MILPLKKAAVHEIIESLLPSFEWALPGLKVEYRNLGPYSGQWLAPSTIAICEENPTLEAFFHELLHGYCYVSGLFERFHTTAPTLDNFDEYFEEALEAERFVETAAMELCHRIFPEYVWEHEAYREFREQEILYNDLLDQANQNSCLSQMFKGRRRRPDNKEKMTAINSTQLEFHQRVEDAMTRASGRNNASFKSYRDRPPTTVEMDSQFMNAMAPSNYSIYWKHDVVEVWINPTPHCYKIFLSLKSPFPSDEWFDQVFIMAKEYLEERLRTQKEARDHLEFLADQTPKVSIESLIKPQTPIQKLMDLFTSNPELMTQAADIITVAQETTVKVE